MKMKKIRCCVIDDEPLASALIMKYIDRTPFLEGVGEFNSCQDAADLILSGGCDLVFLDIQMPRQSGMEFARMIPDSCRVIFTTAYERYALDGFKVNALDYLLKPVDYDEFLLAAKRGLRWFGEHAAQDGCASAAVATAYPEYIIVRSGYKMQQIRVEDIEVIEGLKDYVRIFVCGSDKSVMTLMSMKSLERALSPDIFMRVHRSYIVNTRRISVIERNHLTIGEHRIPVSDGYREQFSDYLAAHSVIVASKDYDA